MREELLELPPTPRPESEGAPDKLERDIALMVEHGPRTLAEHSSTSRPQRNQRQRN